MNTKIICRLATIRFGYLQFLAIGIAAITWSPSPHAFAQRAGERSSHAENAISLLRAPNEFALLSEIKTASRFFHSLGL
jgi:hypothetical protein